METTLYDDNSRNSAKKMKMEMSLNLQNGNPGKMKQERLNDVLITPDVGMFMLSSPDLERFIIQQNGMVLTTPTPTNQILFPKSVTEEQEAYARGFVDALGELHKNNGKSVVGGSDAQNGISLINPALLGATSSNFYPMTIDQKPIMVPAHSMVSQVHPASVYTTLHASKPTQRGLPQQQKATSFQMFQPKLENTSPQTVPTFASGLVTPINMDDQETAKLERKRARNRLAATRCRNRKLERISRLEERVKELKGQNAHLADTAASLREEVFRLKQSIIEHTNSGCQVMLTHNLL